MRWIPLDPWRWRRCFAWHPKRIGNKWIWLERYAWRPLKNPPEKHPSRDILGVIYWEEFQLFDGYMVWRRTIWFMTTPTYDWFTPKPNLKSVA